MSCSWRGVGQWPMEEDRLTAEITYSSAGRCLPFLVDVGERAIFGMLLVTQWLVLVMDMVVVVMVVVQRVMAMLLMMMVIKVYSLFINSTQSILAHQFPSLFTGGRTVPLTLVSIIDHSLSINSLPPFYRVKYGQLICAKAECDNENINY